MGYRLFEGKFDGIRDITSKYINNSLHLARKYARIFVDGHYLFREAHSFPGAQLEENCELRGTSFSRRIFGHVTYLDQSRASENI